MKHKFLRFLELANIKCEELGLTFALVSTAEPSIMAIYVKKFNRTDPHRPFVSYRQRINIHEEVDESIVYELINDLQKKESAYLQFIANEIEIQMETE